MSSQVKKVDDIPYIALQHARKAVEIAKDLLDKLLTHGLSDPFYEDLWKLILELETASSLIAIYLDIEETPKGGKVSVYNPFNKNEVRNCINEAVKILLDLNSLLQLKTVNPRVLKEIYKRIWRVRDALHKIYEVRYYRRW
ncbi:hypothetical protein DRO02_01150 [archaeon]|nr:MAG: hypothetical protein DRO02_01150 [archaeon]RLG66020.1 MAG: hypothetical protein DRO21_00490 [archaeon]RLG66425.1 MAG: hypothetical protein DRN89_00920 [archaeon]